MISRPRNLRHRLLQAVSMRKHLELNRKDKDGKFRLILVESRIHRLARYYRVRARSDVSILHVPSMTAPLLAPACGTK